MDLSNKCAHFFMMQTNPLQVLMFGWELPPENSGGLGVACYGLARGLSTLGVNVNFALPRRLNRQIPFMNLLSHTLQGVEFTAINSLLKSYLSQSQYLSLYPEYYRDHIKIYGNTLYEESLRFADMAASWSRRVPHQIIHSHDWMTYYAGIRAAQMSGKPFIAHVHATEYDRTGGYLDNQIAQIEYQGLQRADKVVAVSHYTKNIIHQYYQVPQDKIVVVHNGVDQVEFTPQDVRRLFPHDQIVLFVGRLTFQKGVDYFLHSARMVLDQNPNTVFLVVGDGDMYQQLILQAASLDIANRVIFTGFLSGDKLRAVYSMADVFVMPSISEPYGIVALEAIASGTPAILSKQSGVAETLNSVIKVDFWDTHKIASSIVELLRQPGFARDLARHAQHELQHLTWENAAYKTLNVYHSLLN